MEIGSKTTLVNLQHLKALSSQRAQKLEVGWWTLLESLDPDALEVGEQQSKHGVEKRIISAELDRFMG